MLGLLTTFDNRAVMATTMESTMLTCEWPESYAFFRLVVFLDHEQVPANKETLNQFAHKALEAGARSILCAGSAGELLHEYFDQAVIDGDYDMEEAQDCIMTTWHTDEPVDEVLWQAFYMAYSCERFEAETPPILIALLEDDYRIDELETLSQNLDTAFAAVVHRDKYQPVKDSEASWHILEDFE